VNRESDACCFFLQGETFTCGDVEPFDVGDFGMLRIVPGLLLAIVVAAPCLADCGTCDKTIVEVAVGSDDFKTLVAAVKAADLVDTLSGEGPFTVFAPTDEAFGKLPKGTLDELLKPENKKKLAGILTYHVVAGKVMAADVVKLKAAETVQGRKARIRVKEGKVRVNRANVVKTDIVCKNGVIHVIDAVILPPQPKGKKKKK
jgi:uncharacterized surface protein with fasciclin (FAS1) repeats